ncbi:RdgB/HAM1 family non-canonical purine NTP pyrophosphatase [Trueperella bialowiezensis]|uniref:dITP/XTP pyrophosphatase n=1 Tax=Trueperella bialowiezensis TaxID=312285 RepID=A0A448PGE1_9ACTO|nr:RdgB/HAM1 family non-canonical purine NTP pyrophosphatase [Trueperella bialowiezensis]VEI14005.1 Non-canonical purine NTP pyrophosphatase [Trueperella bialowiezensis]
MGVIYFATGNAHKLAEVREIVQPLVPGLSDILGMPSDLGEPVEDGVSFAENAAIKARHVADALGVPAMADDSGLCVDVMGGAPGIFSARWAGRHGDDAANLDLLLAQLADVLPGNRGARFVCAAALALPSGEVMIEEGEMRGSLRFERAGSNGFGYDPIFEPEGFTVTNAELTPTQKNAISHRRKAFEKLAAHIPGVLG